MLCSWDFKESKTAQSHLWCRFRMFVEVPAIKHQISAFVWLKFHTSRYQLCVWSECFKHLQHKHCHWSNDQHMQVETTKWDSGESNSNAIWWKLVLHQRIISYSWLNVAWVDKIFINIILTFCHEKYYHCSESQECNFTSLASFFFS